MIEVNCIFASARSTRHSSAHWMCAGHRTLYKYARCIPFAHRYGYRVETHTATLKAHEARFEEIGRLAGRMKIVEDALTNISGAFFSCFETRVCCAAPVLPEHCIKQVYADQAAYCTSLLHLAGERSLRFC